MNRHHPSPRGLRWRIFLLGAAWLGFSAFADGGGAPAGSGLPAYLHWNASLETLEMSAAPEPRPEPGPEPDELFGPVLRETPVPPLHELEARGAEIGQIFIRVGDIFDPENPKENHRLFLIANRLKFRTRQQVVERQLLFRPGDSFSIYRLEESERILRSLPYLYDAEIRPVAYRGNRVDLEVRTRDVWTLKFALGLSRQGGENETRFEIQDSNFLGTGKALTLKHATDVDRDSSLLRYQDYHLLDTRTRLDFFYGDNSDGNLYKVKLDRPFFSLETRWAAGLEVLVNDRVDSIYTLGRVTDQFRHDRTFVQLHGGLSEGMVDDRAHRWLAGFTYRSKRFGPADGPIRLHTPLVDRTQSYPWIGFESAGNRFEKTQNLNLIGRTEDLELGHRFFARLGWSTPLLGGDKDEAIFDVGASFASAPGPDQLLFLSSYVTGRWDGDREENLRFGGSATYYWRNIGRHVLFARFAADGTLNRDLETQLLLGGDSGLRGYPLRYQDGDRRILLTLEQRFYSNWQLFRLAYVGAAIFADVGSAWFQSEDNKAELGVLTNVGLGLRLSPSRSAFGSMLHFDVAFPLDGDESIDKVQWLVSTKETF